MTKELLTVLILFSLKHFFADFPLQTSRMVMGKGRSGFAWISPLSAHCGVHAALTFLIILFVRPSMWWLAVIEFVIHMAIDRTKTQYQLPQGDWGANKGKYLSKYYFAFGLDQLAHQLSYLFLVYFLWNN